MDIGLEAVEKKGKDQRKRELADHNFAIEAKHCLGIEVDG